MSEIFEFKKKLDSVGKGFCLAKWEQVTLHLYNGTTHSCHHPGVHKIPLQEIKNNPSAIHNTNYKKLQRKIMLENGRPAECHFCWNIEDSSPTCFSDRVHKSFSIAPENFEKIKNLDWQEDYNPAYVEVSFSNLCNMACVYCSPIISSRYMEEVRKYGPTIAHDLDYDKDKLPIEGDNPYVKAFWAWFPQLYKELKFFRITGGEPLINKDTYLILDKMLQDPKEGLQLSINSNLSIPDSYFNIFLKYLEKIENSVFRDNFILFTSLESVGKQAEYARYGLDFEKWLRNVTTIFENFNIVISIMCTYNALSVSTFLEFLKLVKHFKIRKPKEFRIDIPYLEFPKFMSILILDEDFFIPKIDEQIKFMHEISLFTDFERNRIKQLKDFYMHFRKFLAEEELDSLRRSFYQFFKENDRRRNLNFLDVFPEFKDYWMEGN